MRSTEPAPAVNPLPRCSWLVERGPFSPASELALLREQRIDLLVCRNSGGASGRAKLDAARHLGVPVVMVARPPPPAVSGQAVEHFESVDALVAWMQ